MDMNKLIGAGKQFVGSVKQAVGKVAGDTKLQSDGKADKLEGKTQNAIGGLKDTVRDALPGGRS
jgi:uncharacterized protein YjbJ (UPF0337 family)